MKMKFKKGDQVLITTGKDKGKTGAILKTSPTTNKVTVAGINITKKAKRPNPQTGEEGGFVEKEAPIHASNIAFVDGNGRPSRKRV